MHWFSRTIAPDARTPTVDKETIDAEVRLAYELVLAREPDPEGRRHFGQLMAEGLSFRALVEELLNSPEYQERRASVSDGPGVEPSVSTAPNPNAEEAIIRPADIIARYSVEELIETADEYFDYYRDYHAFWKLYGLALPDVVLQKIYYRNAIKLIPRLPWVEPAAQPPTAR